MSGPLRTAARSDAGPRPAAPRHTTELPTVPALGAVYRSALVGAVRPTAGPHRSATLPDVAYEVHGVQADADRLTAYQHLIGEPGTDGLPAGFVHVLAFPLAMALMTRDDFPLRVLGLVHVANHVEQRAQVRLGTPLDVRAWAADLRPHHAGTQVDLVTEAAVDGETVWRGVSTYLAKGVRPSPADRRVTRSDDETAAAEDVTAAPDDEPRTPDRPPFEPPVPTASWRLPADTGRRYAAVSGDVNPIHLWTPAAKAFGFRRTIAHGMFTAARALAAVGAGRGESFIWSVDFASPVVLPTTVAVRVAADGPGPGYRLTVWDPRRARPHLTGSVVPS